MCVGLELVNLLNDLFLITVMYFEQYMYNRLQTFFVSNLSLK